MFACIAPSPPPSTNDYSATTLAQVLDIQKLNVDVQIMRSIASKLALAKYPDPKGLDAKSFMIAIKTVYYSASTLDSQSRNINIFEPFLLLSFSIY